MNLRVRVRARDLGGEETTRDLDISLINEPPVIDSVKSDVFARGPQIDQNQQVEIGNLGNRRYRVVIEARPDPGVDAKIDYRAHEKYGQDLTARADLDGDGNVDGDPVEGVQKAPSGQAAGKAARTSPAPVSRKAAKTKTAAPAAPKNAFAAAIAAARRNNPSLGFGK